MSKIIIYGYKLGTHTHSYIFDGFYRAFSAMGHDVYWVDKDDDLSAMNLSDAIFFTAGETDAGIPLRKDCKYVTHNCGTYEGIGKRLNIQYLTYESYQYEQVAPGITYKDDCLYFPWGSPLLPWEFDEGDLVASRTNNVYFLGTVNGPKDGGNYNAVAKFANACKKNGHDFIAGGGYTGGSNNKNISYIKGWISNDDHYSLLKTAYMAPALQGENQLGNGMIPCRIFKAISFGNDAITNNPLAKQFFGGEVVHNPDCASLFHDANSRRGEIDRRQWLFNEVKTKHTYIQRCEQILKML